MLSNSCALCEREGKFQVEDLPVGPRWFCTEKHFAKYTGLPLRDEGYYGLASEEQIHNKKRHWAGKSCDWCGNNPKMGIKVQVDSGMRFGTQYADLVNEVCSKECKEDMEYSIFDEDAAKERKPNELPPRMPGLFQREWVAESKKLPPVEKAEISGIASGATIEGLDLAFAAEEDYLTEGHTLLDMGWKGGKFQVKRFDYGEDEVECGICGENQNTNYLVECLYHEAMPYEYYQHMMCSDCMRDIITTPESACPHCAEDFHAEEEPPEKDDPLESWMEDFDAEDHIFINAHNQFRAEEPSAYEFVKEEIIKASPITESEVNLFLDKLSNVPISYLKEARSEAIKLQDEMAVGIITMAINRRSFREEWASEEDDYVEMMSCPHCSEFGDGEIPTGVDIDSGDRWSPPTADITGWEMCEYCEGKGEVEDTPENEKIPTWDWDYLIPDEPDYDRYEGRYDDWDAEGEDADAIVVWELIQQNLNNPDTVRLYYEVMGFGDPDEYEGDDMATTVAEGFQQNSQNQDFINYLSQQLGFDIQEAEETNGDRQLEESIKRTKMSYIRTGLAITTFGIVLWNLFTNRKQEKQISDIMGLV